MKKIGFEALIYDVHTRSLRSGDKSTRIILEIDHPSDELISKINELHKPDRLVGVAIAERPKK